MPLLHQSGFSALKVMNAVVWTTANVVLIGLSVTLAFTSRQRDVALVPVIAAFLLIAAGNISVQLALLDVFSLPLLQSAGPFSLLMTALIGVAALQPSAHEIGTDNPVRRAPSGSSRPTLLIVTFVLAVLGLIFGPSIGARVSTIMVAAVLTVMFLLVVLRVYLTSRSLDRSHLRMAHQAKHDSATGLPNSIGLAERYSRLSANGDPAVAVLLMRLRSFHEVGQLWSVAIRDRWISQLASQLEHAVVSEGMLARVGADQFVLLAHQREQEALNATAAKMIDATRSVTVDGTISITSSANIGISPSRAEDSLVALLREAESALDLAQDQGEDVYVHYDSAMAANQHRRLILLTALRNVVERDELVLNFQPIVDMQTRQTIAHEALLRWNSRFLGNVSPAEFIPLAESIDSIDDRTDWVLDAGCSAIRQTPPNPHGGYRLSVNVSARSLRKPGLTRRVSQALQRNGISPRDLCIEVTEREDFEDRHNELAALRKLGVVIAIDDFGSGYSTITMLSKVAADIVKLDIEFVRLIESNVAMHGLCRSLAAANVRVVAEGIEAEAQHDLLLRLGCRYGQGWLYGRPQAVMRSALG